MSKRKILRENFARKLIDIRKSKGLTQIDISKLTGISLRMIAHYETKVKYPSPDKLMLLAKALKVSIDELLGYKPVKEKEIIKNRKLLKKLKMADDLPLKDQKAIIHYIDALVAKQKM